MAQTYNSPGVYRQEVFLKAPPVLQTGVPGFVGFSGPPVVGGLGYEVGRRAPLVAPTVTANTASGALPAGTYFTKIAYFDASGESIASPEATTILAAQGSLIVNAPVDQPAAASGYNIYICSRSGAQALQGVVSGTPGTWLNFTRNTSLANGSFNQPVVLNRKEEFSLYFSSLAGSFLEEAVGGFFDNGGTRCYVVSADSANDPVQALRDAIRALELVDGLDLVAIPDAMTLRSFDGTPDKQAIAVVQAEALIHCGQQGNRLAILDSLPAAGGEDVMDQCKQLVVGQQEPVSGALYYPWLLTTSNPKPVPPCGHVAGIYARSDARVGVFKAPANEEIFGVLDLETQIDNSIQDKLNPARVNCLRALPGRGIRVWGARTIGPVPPDPNWLYVNVRRLFLTLRRWIDLNMGWATFEPNDGRLWVRIQRELSAFLTKLLRDGALQGATPAEAFYIKCDAENNPAELRDIGQVVIEIGLAPLSSAEFIVVRIVRQAGGAPDN